MTQHASPGDAGSGSDATSRRTSLWQLALVAVALGVFSLFVLLPTGLVTVLFGAVGGFLRAAQVLNRLGALEPGLFEGSMTLALVLVCLGLAGVAAVWLWGLLLRLAEPPHKLPLLLRWPWVLFGGLLLLACHLFIPEGGGRSVLPVLPGGLVLATTLWLVLTLVSSLIELSLGGLALCWYLARRSPFGAGLLTLGGLGSAAFVLTLFGLVTEVVESQARRLPAPRTLSACERTWSSECTRQLLMAAESPGRVPSLDAPRSSKVRDCLDSQYKNRDMLERAWRIAAASVGREDAWDIVHATLLSVCLQAGDRYDFERFFLRSIENGVRSWWRRPLNARTCSIEVSPEPVCDLRPDDEYVRGETHEAVRKALCALNEDDRQVLHLRYFEELDEQAIAQRLGIQYAAARKRLQRARDKLEREFLQRCQ